MSALVMSSIAVKFAIFSAAVMAIFATILDIATVRALLVAAVSGFLTACGTVVSSRMQAHRSRDIADRVSRVEQKVESGVQGVQRVEQKVDEVKSQTGSDA